MNKKMTAIFMACVLMLLPAALSGCEEAQKTAAPSSSVPEPTQAPTPEPTAAPTASPTPEPTPEPTATPVPVDVEGLFEQNPIDAQKEEDLANASTGRAAYEAFHTAEESWRTFVANLTTLIYNDMGLRSDQTAEDGAQAFQTAAEKWAAETEDAIKSVAENPSDEEADEIGIKTESAALAADLYRERALELCRQYAALTGEFPDFETILNSPMG